MYWIACVIANAVRSCRARREEAVVYARDVKGSSGQKAKPHQCSLLRRAIIELCPAPHSYGFCRLTGEPGGDRF